MIGVAVYILCAMTALACAVLLARGYLRTRLPLLLSSAVCFAGLTLANVVLVIDLIVLPQVDLTVIRSGITLASLSVLIFSLVWETTP